MQNFLNLELQSMEQDHEKLLSGLESLILDTFSIIKDRQDMIAAKEAGLLSEASLSLFANKANDYLTKVSPDNTIAVSGLESDFRGNKEAGLESVMDSIKKGLTAFVAFIKKVLENVETFFKNVYTKIVTRTKDIEAKLKELEDKVAKMDAFPSVNGEIFTKIATNNSILFSAMDSKFSKNQESKLIESLLESIPDIMSFYSDPKLPIVDSVEEDSITFKFEIASTLELKLIANLMKKYGPDSDKLHALLYKDFEERKLSEELKNSVGIRIIDIRKNRISFFVYNKRGTMNRQAYNFNYNDFFSDYKTTELNIDKAIVVKAIAALKEAIKSIPKLRIENEKRIDSVKKASNSIVKMLEQEIADEKDSGSTTVRDRFSEVLKDVTVIWRIYPDVNNSTIRALHSHVEEYAGYINSIVTGKKAEGAIEEVDTEIVE